MGDRVPAQVSNELPLFGGQFAMGVYCRLVKHHRSKASSVIPCAVSCFLRYDPPGVLRLAADVVRASKPHGYNLDSLAMKEVVKLVEAIFADHRSEIQDPASISCLLNLLDAFVEAGWPDALQLVWRLDEIYR